MGSCHIIYPPGPPRWQPAAIDREKTPISERGRMSEWVLKNVPSSLLQPAAIIFFASHVAHVPTQKISNKKIKFSKIYSE